MVQWMYVIQIICEKLERVFGGLSPARRIF